MSETLPGIPGQIVGEDRTPGYRTSPIPVRAVHPRVAMYVSSLVADGSLSEEEAMRLLYPEEAARMFDLDHNRNR